ncbi:CBS domain-containing protein [Haloechinothrix sp. LS1_15]|uniref:CBS domain-containing protein n=1 Tax=Haloechinothrix sp. LS1_15 TaxID=2652248 RepID=UPI002945977A|nr:CBS domain-containing protein [Haloechinothrix sp. LS1_15]MDV6013399.1 CBS domain-containing protein [Haloechinothrix sp. LS1_15]
MTTAREIMHQGAQCVGEHESLQAAARMMRELDVGVLPICGDDNRLHGMLTDRDIVVKCLAEGKDPAITEARALARGKPFWVSVDADVRDVLAMMREHQVRRLPVIDDHQLVGIITEADIASHLPPEQVGRFVESVTTIN